MMARMLLLVFACSLLTAPYALSAVRDYSLVIAQDSIEIMDRTAAGMTINGGIPGPTLHFSKGETARISVKNDMDVATSIHWHGLLVPPGMDGVPFVTQPSIAPGDTYVYEFPIRQTGTYWYHSHSGLQEQRGLYGSIVIDDSQHMPDRDYVVLLSDWTTDSPDSVIKTLKRGSEWYALQKGSSQSILGAARKGRLGDYFQRELQRMPPMDLADVAYDYFLSNGKPSISLEAKFHETIRLRVINGSATTYFHLNFSGGPMTIISADGQLVEPVEKDLFLIGVAETYDVLVRIPREGAFEFRATAHDGSGFTSTWLGEGQKITARSIPKPNLYKPMDHAGMGSTFALTPAGTMGMPDHLVEQGDFDSPGMTHDLHEAPHDQMVETHEMMNMQSGDMKVGISGVEDKKPEHSSMAGMHNSKKQAHTMKDGAGHSSHEPPSIPSHSKQKETSKMPTMDRGHMADEKSTSPVHARSFGNNFGFLETDISSRDNLATEGGVERPTTPYKDLKARSVTALPSEAPVREVRLTLDGDMERYTWFLNNKPLSETDSIKINAGEVTRFIMINRTMMHHPMHLHGHFFRVFNGQEEYSPLKHTVDVAPMSTTVIEFYGDEIGDWFFHCHLLYHMKSGMARLVHYQEFEPDQSVKDVRSQLYKDPFYFYGFADISSNMTEGVLTAANSRFSFEAAWEVGWQGVEETEWEGLLTVDYHINRFTSFFAGGDFLGEGSESETSRGVLGVRYLLPLNFESFAWLDTDGGGRFFLGKELELTPRLGLHGEVEYDTHTQWEGKVELSYLISRDFSIIGNWHSEFGFGAGLQIRF